MIFPILKEYKVIMVNKQTGAKTIFFNHNPDNIWASARMAKKSYPNLRLVTITSERVISLEDCFP